MTYGIGVVAGQRLASLCAMQNLGGLVTQHGVAGCLWSWFASSL